MKFVTVYDPDTHTKREIPVSELAPHMVQIMPMEDDSILYADVRKLKPVDKLLRPPFSGEKGQILKQLYKELIEVWPRTYKEWEDGFRRSVDPDAEIRSWQKILFQYKRLIAGGTPTLARKKDYFFLCWSWRFSMDKEKQAVIATSPLKELTKEDAGSVLDTLMQMPSGWFGGSFAKMWPGFGAWDFDAVGNSERFAKIVAADQLILAVDWMTGRHQPVYGRQLIKDVASAVRPEGKYGASAFAFDFETDHLETLCAAVKLTKGWYEWNGKTFK